MTTEHSECKAALVSPRQPRGRPPLGCAWLGGHYVSVVSGKPHCAAHSRQRFLQAMLRQGEILGSGEERPQTKVGKVGAQERSVA